MRSTALRTLTVSLICTLLLSGTFPAGDVRSTLPRRLEILFLGHESRHHRSDELASILLKEYFKAGINISYTTDPGALNDDNLSKYDGLVLYANHDSITAAQSTALLAFVAGGKGFIPLHCASWCFRNDPEIVALIGGQFKTHKYDSFPAVIKKPEHPVMKDVPAFWTKDETYVHDKLNPDIEVLSERVEGDHREPYTWVRRHGKGRVFYTAYGHDINTFRTPGFLELVKNGILWAVGDEALARMKAFPIANPGYFDGPVPNYEKRDPAPKVQSSLSPQESMSLMQVPVDFELKLFAAEPMVINPIYINWDERGRLWVIETVDYPNEIREDDKADDRIKILEDTDGDGRADKSTIFADKLNIPTSFTFVNGGIMVSAAPSFIFLKDTNGDDRADVRQTILNGWGKWDTHAQASNLRYGIDNMLWGVVGYSGFKGKPGADSMKFSQGVYRFTADGKRLDFLSNTSNNTWGLGFSEEADVFISTANNTHTAFYGGIPKRLFEKAGMPKQSGVKKLDAHYNMRVATKNLRQVDVHGGFTAAAGHSLYTARTYPREYWNRMAFVTEPTGRLVHNIRLEQQGAGFREVGDGWNLLVSADEWAGPIQAEVGPDGVVWVTDWYDFIIQHNPTPSLERGGLKAENGAGNAYINPLRDHERGRIYRIVPKTTGAAQPKSLRKEDTKGLLTALSDPNMFWRLTAQRLLVERRDRSIVPALTAMVANVKVDEMGLNPGALHALWTLHGLGAFSGGTPSATLIKALKHPAPAVRRSAIQMLPQTAASLEAIRQSGAFADADLRVRLSALLLLTDLAPSAATGGQIARMLGDDANVADEWIRQALLVSGRLHRTPFSTAWKGAATNVSGDTAVARQRSELVKSIMEGPVVEQPADPNAGAKPDKTIILRVVKDVMKYDQTLLTAKVGSLLRIDFRNPDFMQHNLLVLKPGTMNKVGDAADKLAQDPNGSKMQYVPKMPEVVAYTPLVNPQSAYVLTFRVPDQPGDYPFVCTFPGHWRIMNGILRVTK